MNEANEARGAVVEIYERTSREVTDVGAGSILAPNEIRINGVPLYSPLDSPPVVERIGVGDLVRVTVTVWARRVIIDAAPVGEQADYARGGVLPSGLSTVYNSTGEAEQVVPLA